jgi:uncharacterized PurR-regulated membrane protein YhhQ (DUF165 family)
MKAPTTLKDALDASWSAFVIVGLLALWIYLRWRSAKRVYNRLRLGRLGNGGIQTLFDKKS